MRAQESSSSSNQPSDTTGTVEIKDVTATKSDYEEQGEINTKDYLPNEINELDEENITTKIYKSSDPALDLIEDNSNLDPSIENDVLSKDELFQKSKKCTKQKYFQRHKKKELTVISVPSKRELLPWLVLIVLVLFLSLLFRFLLKKKI